MVDLDHPVGGVEHRDGRRAVAEELLEEGAFAFERGFYLAPFVDVARGDDDAADMGVIEQVAADHLDVDRFGVFAFEAQLHGGAGFGFGEHLLEGARPGGLVFFGNQGGETLTERGFGALAENVQARGALVDDAAVAFEDRGEVGGVFQDGPEEVFLTPQAFFGVTLLGDVVHDADRSRTAIRGNHRRAGQLDPDRPSIFGFERDGVLFRAHPDPQKGAAGQTIADLRGNQQLVCHFALDFVERKTGDRGQAAVGEFDDAVFVDLEKALVHGLDQRTVTPLAVFDHRIEGSPLQAAGQHPFADRQAQLQGGDAGRRPDVVVGARFEGGPQVGRGFGARQRDDVGLIARNLADRADERHRAGIGFEVDDGELEEVDGNRGERRLALRANEDRVRALLEQILDRALLRGIRDHD